MESGNYTLNHGLANTDADGVVEAALASCDADNKFCDEEFDIELDENAAGYSMRVPDDGHFINDGLDATDIGQGDLGDCWFLSALSSLAQPLPDDCPLKVKQVAVERVIQRETNSTDEAKAAGVYRFKFFRMGEWVDIVVDDQLPQRKRAYPSETGEWWVPLVEKAYAKFNGSYDKIEGGTMGRAMTDLTGGISVEMENLNYDNAVVAPGKADDKGVDLYNIFRKFQHRAVVCTSYSGDGGNETIVRGLVCGHAYSLLQLDEVKLDDGSTERIVKIRNPWARREWDGPWCDGSEEWEHVPDEEKERIDYTNKNDGGFWMCFKDWVDEFEMFTICILPRLDPDDSDAGDEMAEQEAQDRDHRVIGTFTPGVNAPANLEEMKKFKVPEFNAQVFLEFEPLFLNRGRRNIWLQYLLDSPLKEKRYLTFNVYQLDEDADEPESKLTVRQLLNATTLDPSLPAEKAHLTYEYRHNGYLYALEPNRKYVIVATSATPEPSDQECKFMIRTIGPRITMKHLDD